MSLVGRFQGYRGVCHSSRVLQNKPLPTLLVSPNAPEPSQLHKPLRRAQIQVEEEEVLRLWLPPLLARSKLLRMCLRVLGTGNGNEILPLCILTSGAGCPLPIPLLAFTCTSEVVFRAQTYVYPLGVTGQSPHSWLEEGMTLIFHRDLIKRNHKGWRLS